MKLFFLSLSGLFIILLPIVLFYYYVGNGLAFSNCDQNWAAFGSYFGGITGPLLSFLSIILILYTIKQNKDDIEKTNCLNKFEKMDHDLSLLFQLKLAPNTGTCPEVEFQSIYFGAVEITYPNKKEIKAALIELYKITASYYLAYITKRNLDQDSEKYYKSKVKKLIDFLNKNQHCFEKEISSLIEEMAQHTDFAEQIANPLYNKGSSMNPPEETLKSKIINVWVPALSCAGLFAISLFLDLQKPAIEMFWLQRSGAVITILGAWIAFYEAKESFKYINGSIFINNELPYKIMSLILVIIGTVLWGYGDIPFKS